MKSIILLSLMSIVCLSCSNPDDFGLESTEFAYTDQKWELVSITGSYMGSTISGDEMDWQEFYLFSPQGTFARSRTGDGVVTEAKGTFEVVEFESDTSHYLELTYEMGKALVGNCSADDKELLMYRSATEISNTWNICDGPTLDYVLVKN